MDTLRIYLVWSPRFAQGADFSQHILRQFDALGMVRERKRLTVPVRIRCQTLGGLAPRQIDWKLAENNLVVFLCERELIQDVRGPWAGWLSSVRQEVAAKDSTTHLLNVAITKVGYELPGLEHIEAERYVDYRSDYTTTLAGGEPNESMRRLLLSLLSHAGSIVRRRLARSCSSPYDRFVADRPIKIFLSHTHRGGRAVAEAISDHLNKIAAQRAGMVPFLDSEALSIGQNYKREFEHCIQDGVFIAVQSDDYATRRFCRWEMVCAKKHHRPIIVAQMLQKGESRSFPYGGNTPIAVLERPQPIPLVPATSLVKRGLFWRRKSAIATAPLALDYKTGEETPSMRRMIDQLLLAIMSETLRFIIFTSDAKRASIAGGETPAAILPRPPELADIAELQRGRREGRLDSTATIILYPDPPLDDVELGLIDEVSKPFVAMTISEFRSAKRVIGQPSELRHKILKEPKQRLVGIAVANVEETELSALGYQKLEDATSVLWQGLSEVVTVVAQLGGRLGYGGDLRPGGLTRGLFEDVADAYHVLELSMSDRFVHYLACSVWRGENLGRFNLPPADLYKHIQSMDLLGEVQAYFPDGSFLTFRSEDKVRINATARGGQAAAFEGLFASDSDFKRLYDGVRFDATKAGDALTIMREAMAEQEDARFLVGGSLGGSGHYPGVLEEAVASIRKGRLVLSLGAYGGAAHDAAVALGLIPAGGVIRRVRGDKKLHARYYEIIATLESLRETYRDILARHGVPWETAAGLAAADSPEVISELSRSALQSAFGKKASMTG